MRITEQIFLGAGDHSLAQIGHLHTQLAKAIVILGGVQQPPDPCQPPHPNEKQIVEDGHYEVNLIAKEIYVALTGKKPI